MLGDILCNQFLGSHLVTTFSVGDHRDGHGRYALRASGSKKQKEHVFSLCLTRQIIKTDRGRKHAHFVGWAHAPSIFLECRDYRRQKCRDQVSDQKLGANQNVTKKVIDSPTVWVSSLIISVVYVIMMKSWLCLRRHWAKLVSQSITLDSRIHMSCSACRTFIDYQQWASSYHGYFHCFVGENLVILMTFCSTGLKVLIFLKLFFYCFIFLIILCSIIMKYSVLLELLINLLSSGICLASKHFLMLFLF